MNPDGRAGRLAFLMLVLTAAGLVICRAADASDPFHSGAWAAPAKGEAKPPAGAEKGDLGGEPGKDEEAGGGGQEAVIVDGELSEYEAFRVPKDCKNADGSYKQEALIAQQKKRLEVMNRKLTAQFTLAETPHYLIFSDAGAAMTGQFVKMSEALYTSLGKQFAIAANERVWDGKCILVLFGTRALFLDYARVFDGHDSSNAGAYFAWEAVRPGDPKLVHICIPTDNRNSRRLQELFAHEGTHAFFQLYKKNVMLPLWLHEGLAEFMTVVNDPSLRTQKQTYALRLARQSISIQPILGMPAGAGGFSYPAYNVSYTLVDYLVRAGNVKFRKFVDLLKAGKKQDEALKEAYGFDSDELESRWRLYVTDYLMKNR